MNGIVILNKPKGISSNTACRKVGRILNEKKAGHLGTLDPMAEGVLPVSLGKCTKLFDYYLKKNKEYVADFTFGYETDTLDADGEIIFDGGSIPNENELKAVLNLFIGEQQQLPPKYSAKKVNGVRAYDLARNDKDFSLEPKLITIFEFAFIEQVNYNTFRFKISCSSGTYIRSIARDLAKKLNTYATMTKLVRTKCGEFYLENSVDFDNIDESKILKLDNIFKDNLKINLNEMQYNEFINSSRVQFMNSETAENVCLCYNNDIISLGALNMGYFISKIRFI